MLTVGLVLCGTVICVIVVYVAFDLMCEGEGEP